MLEFNFGSDVRSRRGNDYSEKLMTRSCIWNSSSTLILIFTQRPTGMNRCNPGKVGALWCFSSGCQECQMRRRQSDFGAAGNAEPPNAACEQLKPPDCRITGEPWAPIVLITQTNNLEYSDSIIMTLIGCCCINKSEPGFYCSAVGT